MEHHIVDCSKPVGEQESVIAFTQEETTAFKEADVLKAAQAVIDNIQNQISTLEAQITPRRLRDALLGDSSFIDDIETQIQELRTQLGE